MSEGELIKEDSKGCNKHEIGRMCHRVKVLHSCTIEYCRCDADISVKCGDYVIISTRYGKDIGKIQGKANLSESFNEGEIRIIERTATPTDLEKYNELKLREQGAFDVCKGKIIEHGLDMKLVSAHYLLEEPKILFFFIAESRVDFRELVKDLVAIFKTRIELRQIGVRDEARIQGGVGVCGRSFCCHAITDKLNPVSIRMAKEQNLTLNSMKISGPCGRLLCCLSYEYDAYREIKAKLPPEGAVFEYEGEVYKISEMNILSRKVKLIGQSGRFLDMDFNRFAYDEQKEKWTITG